MLRPVLVRAYVEPEPGNGTKRRSVRTSGARRVLVLHTVADERERFVFAVVLEVLDGVVVDEWVIVPDDTADDEVERLADTLPMREDLPPGIGAEPKVLRLAQLGPLLVRRCYRHGCVLAGWDLPWQLGRIASYVGRSSPDGFSLGLGGAVNGDGRWRDSDYLPRIVARSRGAGKAGAFLSWGVPHDKRSRVRKGRRPGAFVDVAVLCGAVVGGELTGPEHAADLLGVPWPSAASGDLIARARSEAGAFVQLQIAACAALEAAAPGLMPERAWSAGSIAQHALRTAGVRPLAHKAAGLPVEVKAAGSASFGGGRVEADLVGLACPMVLVDMRSTFPAMRSALGLTPFLACDHDEVEDVTAELAAFLASPDLPDQLYRRETWARWGPSFAVVEPRGEHLPAQVRWKHDRVGSTVASLDMAGGRLPFMWCDLAASVLEGDKVPKIVHAWRLVPVGRQRGLHALRLPTGVLVDLASDDLDAALVRERAAIREDPSLADHERRRLLSLSKLVANALCFGLPARHNRRLLAACLEHTGHGPRGELLTVKTRHPEVPGPDAFLPLAAPVTAGCSLMIAMARCAMHDLGSTVALIVTDAIAVPASLDGGFIACPGGPHHLDDGIEAVRLVTFDELRALLARFDALLAPWAGSAWSEEAGTLTDSAVGLVCGVNKLVLGRRDHPRRRRESDRWSLVRSSDADMGGHLVDPTGTGARLADGRLAWAGELDRLVLAANAERPTSLPLCIPSELPGWAEESAMRRYRASTWSQLKSLRRAVGDPTVGAFAHYRVAATGGKGPAPTALGTSDDWRMRDEPVGLFVLDDHGQRFVGGDARARRQVRVLSVADHLARWLRENDPSMEGPRRGLRSAVPVFSHPALVEVVGKAGEALWAVDEDPDADVDALVLSYGAPRLDALRTVARRIGRREVARRAGVSARKVRTFATGGRSAPDVVAAVAAGMENYRPCEQCGGRLEGRARRWCSKRCQKAGERAKRGGRSLSPHTWGCPSCAATSDDGHCGACDEAWCTACGTVLLGAARRGPCSTCAEVVS